MDFNVDELKTKIEARMTEHPWQTIGIAVATGAMLGLLTGGRRAAPAPRRGIGGALVAALGAIAMRMLRDAALGQVTGYAREWLGKQDDLRGTATREDLASHDPSIEPFLEH